LKVLIAWQCDFGESGKPDWLVSVAVIGKNAHAGKINAYIFGGKWTFVFPFARRACSWNGLTI